MSKVIIYDLECFPNCFTHTSLDRDTGEVEQFVIHSQRNELVEYIVFLRSVDGMIGFNNLSYDYSLIHLLLTKPSYFERAGVDITTRLLYEQSQTAIKAEFALIPPWEHIIPQLDLFRIHHFNNKAKRTSLKQLEIAMKMDRVQDLPFPYDHLVKAEEIDQILEYNLLDVKATAKFYQLSAEKIELRKSLSSVLSSDPMNFNDPKIGVEIFADQLTRALNVDRKELKNMGTPRSSIKMSDVILDKISFNSPNLRALLDKMKTTIIRNTKGDINFQVIIDQMVYYIGLGGLHAARPADIFVANSTHTIIDSDVASYYPNLSISNSFYPEHLTKTFCKVYHNIYLQRKEYPKGSAHNMAYKLALNGAFGKSNEQTSFLYDPLFTMRITINGQLFLLMLCEWISRFARIVAANTDGVTVWVPRDKIDEYNETCKRWMAYTNLELEHAYYRKLVLRDVNNYLAVDEKGKVKLKGTFQTNQDKISKGEWNKNFSQDIVKIALLRYFTEGIPLVKTIREHPDILDFCKIYKATEGWNAVLVSVDGDRVKEEILQKTNRYFVTTKGGYLMKHHFDGRKEAIEAGYLCTIFNVHTHREISSYRINYDYYLREAEKIRRTVESGQLSMFGF